MCINISGGGQGHKPRPPGHVTPHMETDAVYNVMAYDQHWTDYPWQKPLMLNDLFAFMIRPVVYGQWVLCVIE